MRIGMVVHRERAAAGALAGRVARWARQHGHELVVDTADLTAIDELDPDAAAALRAAMGPSSEEHGSVDVMVGIGGDGTILRAVSHVGDRTVPVLGVHAGQLGYLTEVTDGALEDALDQLSAGTCRTESRMRIAASVSRGTLRPLPGAPDTSAAVSAAPAELPAAGVRANADSAPASPESAGGEPPVIVLNEVVVEKAEPGHTIRLNLYLDDSFFTSYLTDGLIVATPTGSTAYALSARGPIIQPTHQALLLTPVAPHQLFDRSLVLSGDAKVTIELAGHRSAHVVADGILHATLTPGDWLDCVQAANPAELVKVGPDRFHHVLKRKFNLTDR